MNVGCIPSKALLESSELYHRAHSEFQAHGIHVAGLGIDIEAMQARKKGIVKQLTSGIEAMFKAGGVSAYKGRGKLLANNRVEVTTDAGVETLQAQHVVLATGSTPIELPIAKFDGKRIVDSTISGKIAKEVFEAMWGEGKDADAIIEARGLKQITDISAIESAIDQVIAANPSQLADYRAGKEKLFGFFVGQVMKATGGKANPAQLNELLKRKLK